MILSTQEDDHGVRQVHRACACVPVASHCCVGVGLTGSVYHHLVDTTTHTTASLRVQTEDTVMLLIIQSHE